MSIFYLSFLLQNNAVPICRVFYDILSFLLFSFVLSSMLKQHWYLCLIFFHICSYLLQLGFCAQLYWSDFSPRSSHYQAHTFLTHNICGIKSCNEFNSSNYPFYCGVCVCSLARTCLTLYNAMPSRLLCLRNFPGKNPGMVYHFLLQEASWPRDWTCVSYIGRQILYHCK